MSRNRSPLRYAPWLAMDAVVWPLRWFALALVAVSLIVWRFAAKMHLPTSSSRTGIGRAPAFVMPESIAQMVQLGVWNLCLTVAILMTIGGIVGTDLERGYYRSFFSKPMAPWWYYLQRWLLGAGVIVLCPLLLGLGLALAMHGDTGLTWALIGQIGLAYLLIGSATFLLSIFSSKGWLLVFLVNFVQGILAGFTRSGMGLLPDWLVTVHRILPPFHLLQPSQPLPHGGDLRLLLGYGAGMLVLAVIVLRTRPLASGISS